MLQPSRERGHLLTRNPKDTLAPDITCGEVVEMMRLMFDEMSLSPSLSLSHTHTLSLSLLPPPLSHTYTHSLSLSHSNHSKSFFWTLLTTPHMHSPTHITLCCVVCVCVCVCSAAELCCSNLLCAGGGKFARYLETVCIMRHLHCSSLYSQLKCVLASHTYVGTYTRLRVKRVIPYI